MSQARNERTLQLLHRLTLPLDRVLQAADRETGFGAAQISALAVIHYLKATTLSSLAGKERISVPTASRLVESLVEAGLVDRQSDPDDRRAVTLTATEKGRALVKIACDRRAEMLRDLIQGLSEEEWAALSVSAKALNRVFGYDRIVTPTDAQA